MTPAARLRLPRRHRSTGQAIVEFAVVLPFLLLMLMGMMQFGLIFHAYLTLEEAARVGARSWATDNATTYAQITDVVDHAMPTLNPADFGALALSCPPLPGGSGSTSSSTSSSGGAVGSTNLYCCPPPSSTNPNPASCAQPQGTLLEVTVPYTEPVIVPPINAIVGQQVYLNASVVMEAEG